MLHVVSGMTHARMIERGPSHREKHELYERVVFVVVQASAGAMLCSARCVCWELLKETTKGNLQKKRQKDLEHHSPTTEAI